MVVVEPLAGSLAPRLLPRPIAIGNKTFDSMPKDSRKGCPYESKDNIIYFYNRARITTYLPNVTRSDAAFMDGYL